jgi:hypothetical protein
LAIAVKILSEYAAVADVADPKLFWDMNCARAEPINRHQGHFYSNLIFNSQLGAEGSISLNRISNLSVI